MFTNKRSLTIEWGDCDPAGIVFYPRYFAFFDASTAHLFKAAGLKKSDILKKYNAIGFPMVDTRAKFKIPSSYGDEVDIETSIVDIRNSSFDIIHRLYKQGKLAIECTETRVWVGKDDNDDEKLIAKKIPDEVIALLT